MDQRLRDLERAIQADTDDPAALLRWARARHQVQAEGTRRRPTLGDRVRGRALAVVLRAALEATGRREIELLREAGVGEREAGPLIERLRALIRCEPRPWSAVRVWAPLLGLEASHLAGLAEIVPAERPPRREPSPPIEYPDVSCAHCTHRIWAVALGVGVLCGDPRAPLGRRLSTLVGSCAEFQRPMPRAR